MPRNDQAEPRSREEGAMDGPTDRDHDGCRPAFPAPVYRETVLARLFTDAQRFFLDPLLAIHTAHTLMLARQGILRTEEAAACLCALNALDVEAIRAARYDGSCEDLFFFVERKLAEHCGAENAGRMHTARSRNDIDATLYRMVLRDLLLQLACSLLQLRATLLDLTSTHRASLIPAYTHNQPAQPTTLGHYLMAMVECVERDHARLAAAFDRVNRSPLGACAITTTGFPIDREFTARLLGFDGPQTNSYGAIAAADYLSESCSVLAVAMLNLGRFTQDLLLWSTAEFGFLRLSDGFVQGSSIMPQKRNPVPLEHVRALASRALHQAQAVLGTLHNTPFADANDAGDTLQPLAYGAFEEAERGVDLLAGALAEATWDTPRMAAAASRNFLTVTELADTLVRETGIGFRLAHELVAEAIARQPGSDDLPQLAAALARLLAARADLQPMPASLLLQALQPDHFIAVRRVLGGPAPEALDPEIRRSRAQLTADRTWLTGARLRLAQAAASRHDQASALTQPSPAEPSGVAV